MTENLLLANFHLQNIGKEGSNHLQAHQVKTVEYFQHQNSECLDQSTIYLTQQSFQVDTHFIEF